MANDTNAHFVNNGLNINLYISYHFGLGEISGQEM